MQSYNHQPSDEDSVESEYWQALVVPANLAAKPNPSQSPPSYYVSQQHLYGYVVPQRGYRLDGPGSMSDSSFGEMSLISNAININGRQPLTETSYASSSTVAVNSNDFELAVGAHSPAGAEFPSQHAYDTPQDVYMGVGGQAGLSLGELSYTPSPYMDPSPSWPQSSSSFLSFFEASQQPSTSTYASGYDAKPAAYSASCDIERRSHDYQWGDEQSTTGIHSGRNHGASVQAMQETGFWQSSAEANILAGPSHSPSKSLGATNSWIPHYTDSFGASGSSRSLPGLEFSPPPEMQSAAYQVDPSSQSLIPETLSPYSPSLFDASSPMSSSSWGAGPETPQGSPMPQTPQSHFDGGASLPVDPMRPCQCPDGGPATKPERHWIESCKFNPDRLVLKCPVPGCNHLTAGVRPSNLAKHIDRKHPGVDVSDAVVLPRKRSEVIKEMEA